MSNKVINVQFGSDLSMRNLLQSHIEDGTLTGVAIVAKGDDDNFYISWSEELHESEVIAFGAMMSDCALDKMS